MTRIIAGEFKGRSLATPRSDNTRPTTERTREALFSRLDHYDVLEGARVLDLFAGAGTLSLEAMSRGAESAVLVEKAKSVARTALGNVRELGLGRAARVLTASATTYAPAEGEPPFTLVFIDPPYELDESTLAGVLAGLAAPGVLDQDALLVVERSARSPEPVWPPALERFDERRYGDAALWFAQPVLPESEENVDDEETAGKSEEASVDRDAG